MLIKRSVFNKLVHEISEPQSVILLGARRVGKTTLLRAIQAEIERQGLGSCGYFDLEQSEDLRIFNQPPEKIIQILTQSDKCVFVDEFHYLENASKIFKAIYDRQKGPKIFASGSSSLEIHKHLKESLAGRRLVYQIFPLSFDELTQHYGGGSDIFYDYCRYGGNPEIVTQPDPERKQLLLNDLLSTYIQKDIKSLIKEENIRAYNALIYLLAERQGSIISISSLAREIGLNEKTISHYLDILEATYVLYGVSSYSKNLGNELKKSKKYYLYDLGIRNILLKDFSHFNERQDKGVILETFTCLCLRERLTPNMELKFWRTKKGDEVDFILLINREPLPIEVKSTPSSEQIPNGLKKFLDRYPKTKQALVVNQSLSRKTTYNHATVSFVLPEQLSEVLDAL